MQVSESGGNRMQEPKLYVGNLNYSVTEDKLKELFSEHGEIKSVNVIIDRDTGRSKGFGFVEMSNTSEAQKAIDALNGTDLEGRSLRVNESRPKPQGNRNGNSGGGYRNSW